MMKAPEIFLCWLTFGKFCDPGVRVYAGGRVLICKRCGRDLSL